MTEIMVSSTGSLLGCWLSLVEGGDEEHNTLRTKPEDDSYDRTIQIVLPDFQQLHQDVVGRLPVRR
jgi:hypothetical protein